MFRRKVNTDKLLTAEVYAAQCGCSRDKIYRDIREGKLGRLGREWHVVDGVRYINPIAAEAWQKAAGGSSLQLAVARCKAWLKSKALVIVLLVLLLLTWSALGYLGPIYSVEYQRRGLAEELLLAENERLRVATEDLLMLTGKYASIMDVGDALGADIESALKELQEENPNVALPELTLLLLMEQAEFFADWLHTSIEHDRELLGGYIADARSTPNVWPTKGRIISGFGMRYAARGSSLARVRGAFGWHMHSGVDITGRRGQAIVATADGEVVFAGWQASYGRLVIICHGQYQTYYAHLSHIRVKVGAQVERGDRVGDMGDSGATTGTHLHYEVRLQGTPVNPRKYLP